MTNTQTQAPLTRRQAREIERRTGVRPIAVAPAAPAEHIQLAEASAAAIRHDTGFIERNDVAELRSVVPTEVFDREELSSFANRGLTIRAQKPAALVAKQRRRNVVTVAAAASVAAVASTGLLVPLAQGQSNEAHQADLAAAAKAQDAEAADVVAAKPEVERVVTEVVEAPVEAFDRTDVASFDSEVEAATVTQAATTTNNTQASNGNSSSTSQANSPVAIPADGSTLGIAVALGSGASYVFGAEGPGAYDCSGLVKVALAQRGISVPHSVSGIAAMATPISAAEAQPGDLVVVPGAHIGIYAGGGQQFSAMSPSMGIGYGALWGNYQFYRI
ncbi:C40 family peptidase [Pseudoclavibacter alba]|uniref:NlpC/P60 family protein n=1 Tax=Pseudoclavibacter albus TaxID=272241 RepID=A0ABT2HWI3_9MICO|nr:NlpC/P60 family protein [Pseudoclavibacter alba]MBN6777376.1 C40 family peptidase [Pseudoclavibacter alba]MCT2042668.1 NlpC/P60 family protein [Pseudoclavibacter alba]